MTFWTIFIIRIESYTFFRFRVRSFFHIIFRFEITKSFTTGYLCKERKAELIENLKINLKNFYLFTTDCVSVHID